MRRIVLIASLVLAGSCACLSSGDGFGPAPLLTTMLQVDTGYTPSPDIEWNKGESKVFVLRWTPSEETDHYIVRVSNAPITASNWDRAIPVDTVAGSQDTCWVSLDPLVYENTCIGCGICTGVCPNNAITMIQGRAVINPDSCTSCGQCVLNCPVSAISDTRYGTFYYFAIRAYSDQGAPSEQVACSPEAYSIRYYNDLDRCQHCNSQGTSTCFAVINAPVCPVDAIYWDEDFYIFIDMEKCIHCGRCFEHCRVEGLHSISNIVESETP